MVRRILGCFLAVAMVWQATVAGNHVYAATTYRVTNLGTVPGLTYPEAFGVNDLGVVTGSVEGRPFVWSAQAGMVDLGVPAGFTTAGGVGINNNGQIAVRANKQVNSQYYGHAFRWTQGVYEDLGTLGGTFSEPHGIDSTGRVAGNAYTSSGDIHAFRSTTGTQLVDIDSLGGNYSLGYGINAGGQVVGQAYNSSQQYHAFLWNGTGAMQDLGVLASGQSQANAISDSGIIVGDSTTSGNSYHAFILQNGVMTDLGSLSSGASYGVGVNDAGLVIGTYTDAQNYGHPYLWSRDAGMRDLQGLLDPATGMGWSLGEVNDINNSGQIVGQGSYNGVVSAFLLTPVPEPGSIALLTAGTLCLAIFSWRRRNAV
jgi:probable HAF family extracellular repeat protein